MHAASPCTSHPGPTHRVLLSTANAAVTTTALVDDGSVNDCDQQTALRGIDPTFLQIGECVDSAVAEEGPVRSSRVD